MDELAALGVPMGYLSFQGAGASAGRGSGAPWCVSEWGVDGGLGGSYPVDLPAFQKALGLPLQLYAPYFCPENDYFAGAGGNGTWPASVADGTLEACGDYAFNDAAPHASKDFYDWFFAKGTAVGMASFEPDFMNQNYNCAAEFVRSVDNATTWQKGMNDAAAAAGVAVQWCYATPSDVLAALELPAVTNFRVSFDFCYGDSWDVGASSLLPSALGKAPSKDTLWTSVNNYTAIPGCPWTPDHEQPAVETHVVLALLTTGPVGISDGLGFTDAPLVRRAVSADGTLLQPCRAATLVDSLFVARAAGDATSAEIYGTYSAGDDASSAVRAWYAVSFRMDRDAAVPRSDLYPSAPDAATPLASRAFDGGAACANGTDALAAGGCLRARASLDAVAFVAPASDATNTTGGTDFAPVVTTVWPDACASGWLLLGELEKYVSLARARFPRAACTDAGVAFAVAGSPGERVAVTAIDAAGVVRVVQVAIGADGAPVDVALP